MDADQKFAELLTLHGMERCPACGKVVDRADVAWNNQDTEAGTPYATIEIICLKCGTSIAHLDTWYPSIDSFDELVDILEDELQKGGEWS